MKKNIRITELENALQELVNKLDAVDDEIKSLSMLAWVHGHRYSGPNYGEALKHAKEILK